jgi:hypothetical protein
MLLNYIVSMCKKHRSRSGLCSVHRDPLPLQGGPPCPSFLLSFDSAVHAVTVRSFLPLNNHIWIYISEQFAAEIAKASVAIGDFWVSSDMPQMPPLPPPMSRPGLLISQAHHGPASLGHCSRYQPYSSSSVAQASLPHPRTNKPGRTLGHIREKRRGLKKNRAGNSQGLSKRFGKPIWDIIRTITDEEFASCTEAQQEYITGKRQEIVEVGSCSREELGM